MALRPPGGADFPLPGGVSAPLQNLHRARLLTLSARSTNPQILRRGLTPIRDELEFDGLPLIETPEAGALHRRDMNKDVLAATLRLNKSITLGRIEPFHGTCRHLSCSDRDCRSRRIARTERKRAAESRSYVVVARRAAAPRNVNPKPRWTCHLERQSAAARDSPPHPPMPPVLSWAPGALFIPEDALGVLRAGSAGRDALL